LRIRARIYSIFNNTKLDENFINKRQEGGIRYARGDCCQIPLAAPLLSATEKKEKGKKKKWKAQKSKQTGENSLGPRSQTKPNPNPTEPNPTELNLEHCRNTGAG